jgi:hypothetical protein
VALPSDPPHPVEALASSAPTAPTWQRVGKALANFSPWALAFCLTGAYFTLDKPGWSTLNLSLCIAMPVIMLARLAWVLLGPDDAQD